MHTIPITNWILVDLKVSLTVLESSRDNLNKPQVAHIVLQVESAIFNKSLINDALTQTSRRLKTGFGYYIAMEKSKYSGFHMHLNAYILT